MPRPASIWFREQTGWYAATLNGTQYESAKTEFRGPEGILRTDSERHARRRRALPAFRGGRGCNIRAIRAKRPLNPGHTARRRRRRKGRARIGQRRELRCDG